MRALREWAPGEQLAAARAADARALDVVAEDHRPAQGPTPPWLWVHQKEQWDDPAWSTSRPGIGLVAWRWRLNAWLCPYPAHVPRTAAGYP